MFYVKIGYIYLYIYSIYKKLLPSQKKKKQSLWKKVCSGCPSSGMFSSFSAFFPPPFNVCHLRESRGAAPVCLLASLSTSCPGLPLTPRLLWDALHMCMCACELWVWRKDSCRARQSLTETEMQACSHTHILTPPIHTNRLFSWSFSKLYPFLWIS